MVMLAIALFLAAPSYSQGYERCIGTGDAARGVTAAMMDCIDQEIDRQDVLLNRTYDARINALSPARAAALRKSERRWVRVRDANCRRDAAQEGGGSLGGVIYSTCILDQTVERTRFVMGFR